MPFKVCVFLGMSPWSFCKSCSWKPFLGFIHWFCGVNQTAQSSICYFLMFQNWAVQLPPAFRINYQPSKENWIFFDSSIIKVIEGTMNSAQCSNKALSFHCTSQKWWRFDNIKAQFERVVLSCNPETSSLFCWDCFCSILHCKFPLWTVWMKIVEMKMTCSCNFVFPHSLPLLWLHLFIVLKLFS